MNFIFDTFKAHLLCTIWTIKNINFYNKITPHFSFSNILLGFWQKPTSAPKLECLLCPRVSVKCHNMIKHKYIEENATCNHNINWNIKGIKTRFWHRAPTGIHSQVQMLEWGI